MIKKDRMEIVDDVIHILWTISLIIYLIFLACSLMSELDTNDPILKTVALFNCVLVLLAVFTGVLFVTKKKLQDFCGNLALILLCIVTSEFLLAGVSIFF